MSNPKKDPACVEDIEMGDAHKGAWLDLGPRHSHNATRRHGFTALSQLFTATQSKLSLSKPEKISLLSIALIFLSLGIWAGFWLKQKNHIASGNEVAKLSSKGAYATISHFSSYWQRHTNTPGIKIGAVAIPTATITLRKDSSSGALRLYFLDSKKKSVGDPVTISFQNGMFLNGSDTITITASDGFHNVVDFDTYQLGDLGTWSVEILEAKGEMEPRANFSLLFQSDISPSLR